MRIINYFQSRASIQNQTNEFDLLFYFSNNESDIILIDNLLNIFRCFQNITPYYNILKKAKKRNKLKIKYNIKDVKCDFNIFPDEINDYINDYTSDTTLYNDLSINYCYRFNNVNPFIYPNSFHLIYFSLPTNNYIIYNKIDENCNIIPNNYELYRKKGEYYYQTDIYFDYKQNNKNFYKIFNTLWHLFLILSFFMFNFIYSFIF